MILRTMEKDVTMAWLIDRLALLKIEDHQDSEEITIVDLVGRTIFVATFKSVRLVMTMPKMLRLELDAYSAQLLVSALKNEASEAHKMRQMSTAVDVPGGVSLYGERAKALELLLERVKALLKSAL